MTVRCLVTGANGFVGRHLLSALIDSRFEVVGIARSNATSDGTPSQVNWVEADILNSASLKETITQIAPDLVFHLAALVNSTSLEDLFRVNVLGTRNLLDALLGSGQSVKRILIATSAAEYGLVDTDDLPVTEDQPLQPLSLYGLSKTMQYLLAKQYYLRDSLPVVLARSFNLSGPGEPTSLVCGAFAKQIAEIETGLQEPILSVGNLSSARDFLDVRDAARALLAVCTKGEVGNVYNICSGLTRTIDSIARALVARSTTAITVAQNPSRFATGDATLIYGDARRIRETTGWRPMIHFEQTLDDLLAYWRRVVGQPPTIQAGIVRGS